MSEEITTKKYSLDTCAILQISNAYPIHMFPKVWEALERLGEEGKIMILDVVYKELSWKDNFAHKWIKDRKSIFVKACSPAVIAKVAEIVKTHPKLIDPENEREQADPYLVAYAIVEGGVVVTCEKPAQKPLQINRKKDKLPNVCEYYGVETVSNTMSETKVIAEWFDTLGLVNIG